MGDRSRRLIPACAGSTRRSCRPRRSSWAHPRMRGEHGHNFRMRDWANGSSPHARGAPSDGRACSCPRRLIPACAGSTASPSVPSACGRAHPRMRGEHVRILACTSLAAGSSPHARGALEDMFLPLEQGRLIPACAGSTTSPQASSMRTRAHPRMRGEHLSWIVALDRSSGSSPHARGARQCACERDSWAGLIPACAGSTGCRTAAASSGWAHPRMRGEHNPALTTGVKAMGSSPHARGALVRRVRDDADERLIPACAGSTLRPAPRAVRGPAHPRMRGEHDASAGNTVV